MYFILNKSVKFSPNVNELSIINEDYNSIMLSKPASRLLLTLINNVNIVVSREYLLKNVWEDYGYTPSNNNLYMSISELRKAFSTLASEANFLITVPKVGLKLEVAIDVLEGKNEISSPSAIEEINDVETPKVKTSKPIGINSYSILNSMLTKLTFLFSLVIISIVFFILESKKAPPIVESKDEYAFKYGTCDVFSHTLSLGIIKSNEEFKNKIKKDIEKLKISCTDTKKNIYFQSTQNRLEQEESNFVGICTYIKNSDKRKCETLKYTSE